MARPANSSAKKRHEDDFTKKAPARQAGRIALLCIVGVALILGVFSVERRVQAASVEPRLEPAAWPVPDQPAEVEQLDDRARLEEALAVLDEAPAEALAVLEVLFHEAKDAEVVVEVSDALVEHASVSWPGGAQGTFLRELAPVALVAARDSAVPPSVTMAQAILESGWGRSSVAQQANNLFGMKAGRSEQGYAPNGGSRYKVFESWEDSLRAHNELLANSKRYAASRVHTDDWNAFLRAIAPVYAASRSYVKLVSDLVRRYGLDRWDGMVHETHQRRARLAAETDPEGATDAQVASAVVAVTEP